MIKVVCNENEKKHVIKICDSAFDVGLYDRENGNDIIDKIVKYADVLVAYVDDTIAGYVAMYSNDMEKKQAYITMIGVLSIFQGRHIGINLINECKIIAKNKGMEEIRLEVKKSNNKAIVVYEKVGFKYEKECSNESIYMTCRIR